jgi:hypothetical protein
MTNVKKHFEQPAHNRSSASQTPGRTFRTVLVIALIGGLASLFMVPRERVAEAKSNGGGVLKSQSAQAVMRQTESNAFPSLAKKSTLKERSLIDMDFFGGLPVAGTYRERLLAAFRSFGPEAEDC